MSEYTVKAEKKPVFCIKEETIQYEIDNAISKFSMEANIID